jgi:hypothetical protein
MRAEQRTREERDRRGRVELTCVECDHVRAERLVRESTQPMGWRESVTRTPACEVTVFYAYERACA